MIANLEKFHFVVIGKHQTNSSGENINSTGRIINSEEKFTHIVKWQVLAQVRHHIGITVMLSSPRRKDRKTARPP